MNDVLHLLLFLYAFILLVLSLSHNKMNTVSRKVISLMDFQQKILPSHSIFYFKQ